MTARIDSIYCFDYTKDIGHYDSIRDFASMEMTYIGLALSTPKVRVNATPNSFNIISEGSTRIREYAISQLSNLQEISKELAENSPKYILICYFDGSKRYYSHNEDFCDLFKIAFQYQPQKESKNTNDNPYIIQNGEAAFSPRYANPVQTNYQQYSAQKTYPQPNNVSRSMTPSKKQSIPWGKLIIGIALLLVIIALIINGVVNDTDSNLTPVTEPRSGAILSGREVFDGSEITITASSGESCIVKLKTSSGIERLSFYVRAGDTVTVGVPTECLYVYFATGETWYGMTHLFGEKTSYSMDDELCDFSEYTWEYTLYPVSHGNFSQTPIDEDNFK